MKRVWKQSQNFMVNVIFRDLSIGAKKTWKKVVEQFQKSEIRPKYQFSYDYPRGRQILVTKGVREKSQIFIIGAVFKALSNAAKKI